MGGFSDRLRHLWHFNVTLGNVWFNSVAIFCNILQIVVTVALLGYFHSKITLEYAWWPSFEVLRLFILTIARVDVILKFNPEYMDNVHSRRIIMLCNLIGAFSIVVGGTIYFVLLPDYSRIMYLLFITVLPIFIFIRLCLTAPMFATLIWGVPLYRLHDGNNYERIADSTISARQGHSDADDLDNEPHRLNNTNVPIYQATFQNEDLYDAMDQRQLEYLFQQNRAENARSLREQQDYEFEEALRQEQQVSNATNGENRSNYQIKVGEIPTKNHNKIEDDSEMEYSAENEALASKIMSLRELPSEPARTSNTVSVRVRLPNNIQIVRLFDCKATIDDVKLWINHKLIDHDSCHLVDNFQLVSTMPRTVYKDGALTLESARFWIPNSKVECRTPVLYVEECVSKEGNTSNNKKEIGEHRITQKA